MKLITPYRNILLNRGLLKLGIRTKPWYINGKLFWFTDAKSSRTPEIVYEELVRGLYTAPKLENEDVVIDLGSHIGMFSIPLAFANRKTTFICVEPNPTNFKNLQKNVKRLKLKNIVLICGGVWDISGIGLSSKYPLNNTGGSHTIENSASKVKSYTWNQIQSIALYHSKSKVIKLLKCDIEGAEHRIFHTKDDFKLVDSIRIEIHGNAIQTAVLSSIVASTSKDYIIQRFFGESEATSIKEEFSSPKRILLNLHGGYTHWLEPY